MIVALCPLDETLIRYAAGDLDDSVAANVDSHLSTCETCLSRIEEVSKDNTLLSDLRHERIFAPTPPALDRAVFAAIQNGTGAGNVTTAMPRWVADYELHEEVGRGGMGQVYRASHPRLNVEVAVKLLRVGFDSPKLRARFVTERETLARMDHPNIAKVFDAGVSADDRPFIVMELLRGTTFTKFVESHDANLRTRLELFRQVCQAIQHAHQKGILHRDMKPSNVIIVRQNEQFVPKVIDFGVARAIDPDVARHTEHGSIVGTLEYMSPEQTWDTVDGVDTRSDLFSLGVLLYELITGDTPTAAIRKQSLPTRDITTMIREDDPPRPSGIAMVAFPSRRIRDELDWITFKALEKDPARRYESAAAFANDIGRLLADEAVHAVPPSRRYRLQKLLRRNRAAAIGSAFVLLALCAGVVGTTWQMLRAMGAEKQSSERATAATLSEQNATHAEDRAVKDRNRAVAAEADANAFNKFLVDHVLAASRPALTKQGLGRSVTLAEALTVAEAQIDRVFADRPTAEIKARIALGQTWFELRRFPDSEKHYLRALELLAQQPVLDVNLQLMCRSVVVQLLYNTSRLVEARKLAETILPQFAEKFGPESDETLTVKMELGLILLMQDQSKPATALLKEVMAGRLKLFGPTHAKSLTAMNNYAQALDDDEKHVDSLAVHREVLKQRRATIGNDHPATMSSMNNVGCQLLKTRQLKDAIEIFEEALPLAKTLLGDEHTTTNSIMNNLGAAYLGRKQHLLAIPILEATRDIRVRTLGATHKESLTTMGVLASAYRAANRLDDAIPVAEIVFRERTKLLGADHAQTRLSGNNLGYYYMAAKRLDEAIAVLEPIAKRGTALDGPEHERTATTSNFLAQAYLRQHRSDLAEPWLVQSLPFAKSDAGCTTPTGRSVLESCGEIFVDKKRYVEAEAILRLAIVEDRTTPDTVTNAKARSDLGMCLFIKKQYAEAESHMLTAQKYLNLGYKKKHKLITDEMMFVVHQRIGELYEAWGQPDKAIEWRNKSPQIVKKLP